MRDDRDLQRVEAYANLPISHENAPHPDDKNFQENT